MFFVVYSKEMSRIAYHNFWVYYTLANKHDDLHVLDADMSKDLLYYADNYDDNVSVDVHGNLFKVNMFNHYIAFVNLLKFLFPKPITPEYTFR